MATRRSWTESASPRRAARVNWNASRRSRMAVWRRAKSRISIARPHHGNRRVIHLAKGFAGALGGPLFQVDIVAAVNLQHHFAVADAAIHAGDALLTAAI